MDVGTKSEKDVIGTALDDEPLTILLVDDQTITAEVVVGAFAGEGQALVHHCMDGRAAMDHARRFHPTVILQDLLMPGINGMDLLQQYRSHSTTRDVPVIMLSSQDKPAVKRQAFGLGASDYIVKPADPIELTARVRHHAKAYRDRVQRDAAYSALRETQRQLLLANTELRRLTKTDGLTGLCNRRFLDEYLATEWKRAVREGTYLSALMIDVDHFKCYNDTYGHPAGDQVLRSVAQTIHASFVRPADFVARFGGEEFMVVLPSTPPVGARYTAEKVRRAVQALAIAHGGSQTKDVVTVSIGVASAVPQHGNAPIDLVRAADMSLYDAKKLGRNRVGLPDIRGRQSPAALGEMAPAALPARYN